MNYHSEIKTGTVGGTLLAVLANSGSEILRTAVMAATGALVSFISSMLCKWAMEWIKKRRET